jgi:hypothetical protein
MKPRSLILALLLFALGAAACGDPPSPIAPTAIVALSPPAPPSPGTLANWSGDAVVVSRTGGAACGWGTREGETRADVRWRITVTAGSIAMEEDMNNWPTDHIPFSGTLVGTRFEATYDNGADYLKWVCQFKGATLSGHFSPDFSSFEAEETLTWGAPGADTVVRRRWLGRRL